MQLIADLHTSARHAQAALFSPDGAELITVMFVTMKPTRGNSSPLWGRTQP